MLTVLCLLHVSMCRNTTIASAISRYRKSFQITCRIAKCVNISTGKESHSMLKPIYAKTHANTVVKTIHHNCNITGSYFLLKWCTTTAITSVLKFCSAMLTILVFGKIFSFIRLLIPSVRSLSKGKKYGKSGQCVRIQRMDKKNPYSSGQKMLPLRPGTTQHRIVSLFQAWTIARVFRVCCGKCSCCHLHSH